MIRGEIQIVVDGERAFRMRQSNQCPPAVFFRVLAEAWDLLAECAIEGAAELSNGRYTIQLIDSRPTAVATMLGHFIAVRLREGGDPRAFVVGWVERSQGSAPPADPGSEAGDANAKRDA